MTTALTGKGNEARCADGAVTEVIDNEITFL
jgi:hypothetical protein